MKIYVIIKYPRQVRHCVIKNNRCWVQLIQSIAWKLRIHLHASRKQELTIYLGCHFQNDGIHPSPKLMANFFQTQKSTWCPHPIRTILVNVWNVCKWSFLCKTYWFFALARYAPGSKGDERDLKKKKVWISLLISWGEISWIHVKFSKPYHWHVLLIL